MESTQSGSAALVHGLRPRVAVMHNSAFKGGAIQTMQILHTSPGLEDIWQLHWAFAAGLEQNTPGLFHRQHRRQCDHRQRFAESSAHIWAAPRPGRPGAPGARKEHTGPAFWIKASAEADGTFSVTNTRNNFTKTYAAR